MEMKTIRDKDIVDQFARFTEAYTTSEPFIHYGGTYMFGLYERQKEIDELERSFDPPTEQ